MPTVTLVSKSGEQVGSLDLSREVFDVEPNVTLMHQAVTEELANLRSGTADTKTRGEVRGGGRKPYRQKGTGRARAGSIRSPLWPGGGTVWGPQTRSYEQNMPKKMRKAAFRSALSTKVKDGAVVVVDDLSVDEGKTKKFVEILTNLEVTGKVLVVVSEISDELVLAARNVPNVWLRVAPAISVSEVLDSNRMIMTKAAAQKLEEAFAK